MRTLSRSQSRRSRLQIETLEGREVPAGMVTASIAGGVLNLVGDDASNTVTIKLEAAQTTVTPDLTTAIGAGLPGVALVIPNVATSLKATMGGGDDTIISDGVTNFSLPGGASIDLGDGFVDSIFINTTQKVDLGSLTVKGTDGYTAIFVAGGAGMASQITGNVKLDLGQDGTNIGFAEIALLGAGGVSATTTEGYDQFTFTNVTGGKPFKAQLGNGGGEVVFNNAKVGAVSATSEFLTVRLQNAAETGAIKIDTLMYSELITSGISKIAGKTSLTTKQASGELYLSMQDTTITGDLSTSTKGGASYTYAELNNVDVTGSVTDKQSGAISYSSFRLENGSDITGNFTMQSSAASTDLNATIDNSKVLGSIKIAGTGKDDVDTQLNLNGLVTTTSVTVQGGYGADFDTNTGSDVTLTGDLKVSAKTLFAVAETRGSFKANNVEVKGPSQASFRARNGALDTIAGKLTLTGKESAFLDVDNGASLNVAGDIKIDGKIFANLDSDGILHTGGKMTMKGSEVSIDVNNGKFTVDGDFSTAASYSTDVTLDPSDNTSTIKGNASLTSGLASDNFSSGPSMKFEKDLFIDLKDGFNGIDIQGTIGTPTVAGKLTLNTGAGNDQVDLTNFSVTGISSFMSGAGADIFNIHSGTTFSDTLAIDQGSGNDTLFVDATGPTAVTFSKKVTANQGSGNDTLLLDLAGAFPPVFSGGGHEFDGGNGLDDNGANPNAPPPVGGVKFQNYEV